MKTAHCLEGTRLQSNEPQESNRPIVCHQTMSFNENKHLIGNRLGKKGKRGRENKQFIGNVT